MERGEKKHKNFSTLDRLEGNVEEVEPEVEEELTDKEIRNAKKSKYKKGVQEELDGIDLEF